MSNTLKRLLLLLAFVEGGAVMCLELCSAKMLSPFFGTSIYVWAAVLGITLMALMAGYYLGGYLSSKKLPLTTIFWIMLCSGCLIALAPVISSKALAITIRLPILPGTVLSLITFLFFPLLLCGSISPLLINELTQQAKDSGRSSGTIYAISTLGGIVTTFLVGFYALPVHGIQQTLLTYGILVIIMAALLFLAKKLVQPSLLSIAAIAVIAIGFNQKTVSENVIYQSDGILGQLKVMDRIYYNHNGDTNYFRELMVNNISQTIMDKDNPTESYWDYVDILTYNASSFTSCNKTLLLGLGGGTVYKQLTQHGFEVDVVEIDQRIAEVAKTYFHINPNVKVYIDDARHYINTCTKTYDLIIYDLYHSETPPVHLMTKEAFAEIHNKLSSDGILIINFYGFVKNNKGKAARSILKTLYHENYNVKLLATPGAEEHRNLLFIAGKRSLVPKNEVVDIVVPEESINLQDAVVLTDNRPQLEHLYLDAALSWRKNYNEINAKLFLTTY